MIKSNNIILIALDRIAMLMIMIIVIVIMIFIDCEQYFLVWSNRSKLETNWNNLV